MIELKITNSAALLLLMERIKIELESQKQSKRISEDMTLENMGFQQSVKIIECAAFDLVCMLPAEVLADENNLPEIITKAIHSLSGIFHKEELNSYSLTQAKDLIRPIEQSLSKALEDFTYKLN